MLLPNRGADPTARGGCPQARLLPAAVLEGQRRDSARLRRAERSRISRARLVARRLHAPVRHENVLIRAFIPEAVERRIGTHSRLQSKSQQRFHLSHLKTTGTSHLTP